MTKERLLREMSAREFLGWSIFLSIKEEDLPKTSVEDQLLGIFGKPK